METAVKNKIINSLHEAAELHKKNQLALKEEVAELAYLLRQNKQETPLLQQRLSRGQAEMMTKKGHVSWQEEDLLLWTPKKDLRKNLSDRRWLKDRYNDKHKAYLQEGEKVVTAYSIIAEVAAALKVPA